MKRDLSSYMFVGIILSAVVLFIHFWFMRTHKYIYSPFHWLPVQNVKSVLLIIIDTLPLLIFEIEWKKVKEKKSYWNFRKMPCGVHSLAHLTMTNFCLFDITLYRIVTCYVALGVWMSHTIHTSIASAAAVVATNKEEINFIAYRFTCSLYNFLYAKYAARLSVHLPAMKEWK